jgi:L-lactate dehydrogenase
VVGAEGVLTDLFPDLDDEEYAALNRSASLLKERADAIPL